MKVLKLLRMERWNKIIGSKRWTGWVDGRESDDEIDRYLILSVPIAHQRITLA
jgi:hypothetical protein